MEGIDQGFLSTLGLPFLCLMYRAIDASDQSVLMVETKDDQVLGFVSGAASLRPIYMYMLRTFFPELLAALLPSLIRPCRLVRIIEIVLYSRNSKRSQVLPNFELLSIVVTASAQGSGCADRLYQRLADYCRERNIKTFKIVVGDSLAPAHKFYLRMGAVAAGRVVVHAGQGSVIYVYDVEKKGN